MRYLEVRAGVWTSLLSKRPLLLANILVWGLVVIFLPAARLKARSGFTIILQSSPDAVKVAIDGTPQFGNKYVHTPVKIGVPPGKHKLSTTREGYISDVRQIWGRAGDLLDLGTVVLEHKTGMAFFTFSVDGDPAVTGAWQVSLNDGLMQGPLPFESADVPVLEGGTYTVQVSGPELKKPLQCHFIFDGKDGNKVKIQATRDAGRWRLTGCLKGP